jgi:hypothetical protein
MGRKFPEVTRDEFRAIDAVYDAYMALNAAQSLRRLGVVPRHDGHADAMGLVADSARAAFRILGFTRGEARRIWAEMVDNGSGTEWNVRLLRDGVIAVNDGRY